MKSDMDDSKSRGNSAAIRRGDKSEIDTISDNSGKS